MFKKGTKMQCFDHDLKKITLKTLFCFDSWTILLENLRIKGAKNLMEAHFEFSLFWLFIASETQSSKNSENNNFGRFLYYR